MRRKYATWAGVASLVLGASIATAGAASATVPPSGLDATVTNTSQVNGSTVFGNEAGFYVKDNGHTRIRYAQATVTANATIEDFTGNGATSLSGTGAVGVELCDPTTTKAAQLGLVWNPTGTGIARTGGTGGWEVLYGAGNFGGDNKGDVCTQGGLSEPLTSATLLDGDGTGTVPTIATNDVLELSIYYNPNGKKHSLQFTVYDETQDWTADVATVSLKTALGVSSINWYEAGIGAFSPGDTLTGGDVNLAAAFSSTAFNYYSSPKWIGSIVNPNWRTAEAQTVNSSDQVTLSATEGATASGPVPGSLNSGGTAFNIYEGSTSP